MSKDRNPIYLGGLLRPLEDNYFCLAISRIGRVNIGLNSLTGIVLDPVRLTDF